MTRSYRPYFSAFAFFLILPFFVDREVFAEDQMVFKTGCADIIYSDDKALSDFMWRISGKRFDFIGDISLAQSRVDRIVARVESILDMHPSNFHLKIYLHPQYKEGDIASYSHKKGAITIYADKVTDGIFAHEVAHAIICNYFSEPPPKKAQEILVQYVDKYLWSDY